MSSPLSRPSVEFTEFQHVAGETYTLGTTPVWVRRDKGERKGVRV